MRSLFFQSLPIFALLSGTAYGLDLNSKWAKVVYACKDPKAGSPHVYFFKQWHLAPEVDTRTGKKYAQSQNLEAIYLQLDAWIQNNELSEIFAEGCEGEINLTSNFKVNGWGLQDLMGKVNTPGYSEIETSVPLKLEAKYGEKIRAICGDSKRLVKEQLLSFSDARGETGYLTRLVQFKDDPVRAKPYLKDAVKLFNLPPNSSTQQVIKVLIRTLESTMHKIRATIEKRNQHLVDILLAAKTKSIAAVFGGMHAEGVAKILERRHVHCTVVEPVGYQNEEPMLLDQMDDALRQLKRSLKEAR